MEFKLLFTTGMNNNTSPFDHFNPGHGLDYVTAIRELAKMPFLDMSIIKVNDTCSMLTGKSHFAFTTENEEHIKNISDFDVAQQSKVIVPAGFLGQYVKMTVELHYESMTETKDRATNDFIDNYPKPKRGFPYPVRHVLWNLRCWLEEGRAQKQWRMFPEARKLIRATNGWEVDKETLYNDWVAAGFPAFWGIDEEVFDRHKEERAKIVAQLTDEKQKAKEEKEAAKKLEKRTTLKHLAEDISSLGRRLEEAIK